MKENNENLDKAETVKSPYVFCSTWVNGKIYNIEKVLLENKKRKIGFVLDTNIIIYIREYYKNPVDFKKQNQKIYRDFIATISFLKKQDIIFFQYGCEESCRDKKQGILDEKKYRETVKCLNCILDKNFSSDVFYNYKTYPILENSKINILKSGSLFGIQSVVRYTALLKAYIIKKTYDDLSDEEKIYEFINFLDKDLNITSPMDVIFAIYYFGHNTCILKKISFDYDVQKILNKIYAAAIDLTIPTLTAQLSEFSYYSMAPIFVTFDKGIKLIYDSLYIVGEDTLNNTIIPKYGYIFYSESCWNDEDYIRINENISKILEKRKKGFESGKRKQCNKNNFFEKCEEVEKELKIKKGLII